MSTNEAKVVLVVEDEIMIWLVIRELLEGEGYQVRVAKNGREALDSLSKEGLPNLILLDMKMPVMDGWQFAAEYDKLYARSAPVVVMTAAGDAAKRAAEVHADAWLGKPFELEYLVNTVKKFTN